MRITLEKGATAVLQPTKTACSIYANASTRVQWRSEPCKGCRCVVAMFFNLHTLVAAYSHVRVRPWVSHLRGIKNPLLLLYDSNHKQRPSPFSTKIVTAVLVWSARREGHIAFPGVYSSCSKLQVFTGHICAVAGSARGRWEAARNRSEWC